MPSWQMIRASLQPFGPSITGNAEVARLPRLDRHPGMELAVVELDFALIVDDNAGIIGISAGIILHDGKTSPDRIVDAGLFEGSDLRPVERAHDFRVGVHRQAVQRVFGEDDEVHGRRGCAAPCRPCATIFSVCAARSAWVTVTGQLQLHQADDHAVLRFVQSAKPFIPVLLFGDREFARRRSSSPLSSTRWRSRSPRVRT